MKKPRWTIRTIEGECTVQLFNSDNILLHSEILDEQEPYLWIARFREAVEQAEIVEIPRTPLTHELNKEIRNTVINDLDKQIKELTLTIASLREYVSMLDKPEKTFVDDLG